MKKFISVNDFINWVQAQKRFSKKVSLDKMRYYCQLLGNPHNKFKSIHITGTNGKGSTVSMLSTILIKNGYNVGTFTSPYVKCFNERISYNQTPISDKELLKIANQIIEIYPKIEESQYELPSFFEFITLIAFIYFSSLTKMDIAIIEVGMGGRLDSTNVITPLISVITNVDLDHMSVLGDTKEKILTEKLGIVKKNIPFICGLKDENLKQIALRRSKEQNAKVTFVDYQKIDIEKCDLNGSIFNYKELENINLSLLGFHQIENAAVVLETCTILKNIIKIDMKIAKQSLSETSWIGRLEVISKKPYILLDGSHNIDGINRVCQFIKSLNIENKRAVVAISHDKELKQMIDILDGCFNEIVFTKYLYSRSADANALYDLSHCKNKIAFDNLDLAVEFIKNNPNELTIFMGSLYLVSEVRDKIILLKK